MKFNILLYVIALLFCSACSRHLYTPALYNDDISYQPKPASFDSVKSATYVSMGEGFNQAVNISNMVSFGEFNISRGHVFNQVNLSYGAFGFAGSIDNSNHDNELKDPNSFKSKGFAGVGGRASVNLFKAMDNINFRYIGIEAVYSKEYGDFAEFRRAVHDLPDYYTSTRTEMVTIGATSEILWHAFNSTNKQYALRLFVGKTIGDYAYPKVGSNEFEFHDIPFYVAVSYFMQIKHFWGAAELTRNDVSIPGIRVKLGYRF